MAKNTQQEYDANAERLNDLRSHWPQSYHLISEYHTLIQRQRELEAVLYPPDEAEEFRIEFRVERFENGWRATLSNDLTEWGFGDTPYAAIEDYCEHYPEWEEIG